MHYPGGKNNVYQRIINLIPPHTVYLEPFVGSGAIARYKLPARLNILIDLDPEAIANLSDVDRITQNGDTAAKWKLLCTDGIEWLKSYPFDGSEFCYCDPPYLLSTRRQTRQIYRCELSDKQHLDLLTCLTSLPCQVMISGYWSQLYAEKLTNWHTVSFQAITRGGSMATEYLWMNYPRPVQLHDYRYLGDNFRERERIRRKKQRWIKRLHKMPTLEKQALLAAFSSIDETNDKEVTYP